MEETSPSLSHLQGKNKDKYLIPENKKKVLNDREFLEFTADDEKVVALLKDV